MGNLDSARDFGHAKDYTEAMIQMLEHPKPTDLVIATGVTHTIQELCDYVFTKLGMNYEDYIDIDPIYFRPEELKQLKGDAALAYKTIGWKPQYTFETLLDDMINNLGGIV